MGKIKINLEKYGTNMYLPEYYYFHCRFELVFKLNISDKLPAFTKHIIFAYKI
jgi:hypothetical protein